MFCIRLDSVHDPAVPSPLARGLLRRECIQSTEAMGKVINSLTAELAAAGYSEKDAFSARMSLEEAIANAIKHGHQGDTTKAVWVNFYADEHGVVFQVTDQGNGFNPAEVPDPCAPENLEKSSGRGLLLMRSYMTNVCHNEKGNCVCFCKHRRPAPQDAL